MIFRELLSKKHFLFFYFLWIFILGAAYYVAINAHIDYLVPFIWALIGLSGIVAIILGVYIHRPSARLGWLFLATANLFFIIGDTQYNIHEYIYHQINAFPSLADVFYLCTYPLFIASMFVFIRKRTAKKSELGAILDAAIFSLGLAMLVWVFLVIPNAIANTSLMVKSLSVAYPLLDVLVWAMLVRLLLTDIHIRAIQFLAIGALGLIISDISYALNQFYGVWSNGSFIDIGWICFYSFWGAAALHPSMKKLDSPAIYKSQTNSIPLYLLATTALIAPALLVVEYIRREVDRAVLSIAIFAAILFILVILRMAILVKAITTREAEISLERKKNEAFSLVSHQLRTPLTAVKQALSLVLDGYVGKITKAQRDLLTIAYNDNERLFRIVEDLLNVGHLDSGILKLNLSKVDCVSLIKDVIREEKPQITKRNQKIKFVHTNKELIVNIDEDRIKMVLENLIDNASKYSPERKEINIALVKLKKYIKIIIKDQGVGISQKDKEKLFLKFSRVDNPLSKSVGGTGLGLYWAKKIIDLHKGSIKVKSTPKRGSTFTITLPM